MGSRRDFPHSMLAVKDLAREAIAKSTHYAAKSACPKGPRTQTLELYGPNTISSMAFNPKNLLFGSQGSCI